VTGWWRANAVALGALAVLAPALIGVVAWNEWSKHDVGQSMHVEAGATAMYSDARIGPAKAEYRDDPLAPAHTRVVSVSLPIDPGDPAITCTPPQLREIGGAGRTWDAASYELDRGWDAQRPTSCVAEATEPYTMVIDYIVPEGASGVFAVELESAESWPVSVSAVVEP
jgi:hypothetical protein